MPCIMRSTYSLGWAAKSYSVDPMRFSLRAIKVASRSYARALSVIGRSRPDACTTPKFHVGTTDVRVAYQAGEIYPCGPRNRMRPYRAPSNAAYGTFCLEDGKSKRRNSSHGEIR